MITGKITEIYFIIDEFHKEFERAKQGILTEDNSLKRRNRKQTLTASEVI